MGVPATTHTDPSMQIPIHQVAAFTDGDLPFTGNPAAICLLDEWIDADLMQGIASENNLSETAFLVRCDGARGDEHQIRWFTPTTEVDLCGHATLAAAFVLNRARSQGAFAFHSRSGRLVVSVLEDGWLELDLPAQAPVPCEIPSELRRGLDPVPASVHRHDDYLAIYPMGTDLRGIEVDLRELAEIDLRGVIVTAQSAPGSDVDFTSRFFSPGFGIDEDPATGSAHCQLVPYWSGVIGRTEFLARQVSARGGLLRCRNLGNRVLIAGRCRSFLEGAVEV